MNSIKSLIPIALVIGMVLLAVMGFNITTVHAHGHGDHYHECRSSQTQENHEECRNHEGEWESSGGN